jgi:hypothetical protein
MTPADQQLCNDIGPNCFAWEADRGTVSADARNSRAAAVAIRAGPNSKANTEQYFQQCRDALALYQDWEARIIRAALSWQRLRNMYRRNPAPSAGQLSSRAEANVRRAACVTERQPVSADIATILTWINTAPIYVTPGLGPPMVLEDHVPRERFQNPPPPPPAGNFNNNGIVGAWQTVPGRALGSPLMPNRPLLWYQIDGNGNIVDVRIRVLVGAMFSTNSCPHRGSSEKCVECQSQMTFMITFTSGEPCRGNWRLSGGRRCLKQDSQACQ